MDDKGKTKSTLGNDQKLDREKNDVTGVKTSDQLLEERGKTKDTDTARPNPGPARQSPGTQGQQHKP
jgi:hypothetical protein